MDLTKLARSAIQVGGALPSMKPGNAEGIDSKIRYQYLAMDTSEYADTYGVYASNCYDTEAQGIDLNDWYKYVPVRIRVAPVGSSATGETMLDDWQKIFIIAPIEINYIGQGAMMEFEGNTWIVYKPENVGGVIGNAIVRRCNSVINTLDYYGNIVATPMSFAKMGTQGNAPQINENMILSKNYMNCICQLNAVTKEFRENTRFIQGNAAYTMRGLNNFTREFTNDPDSAHLLTFTIERSEPLEQDNLELGVADYYSFSWRIVLNAPVEIPVGGSRSIGIKSVRNGVEAADSVEYPIGYLFTSSDESILSVDESGTLTANATGTATITVTLEQNPTIQSSVEITVAESGGGSQGYVAFTSSPVTALREGDSATITAAYFKGGEESGDTVNFTFSGAPESAYTSAQDGNTVTVTAMRAANLPLTITATANGSEETIAIRLVT